MKTGFLICGAIFFAIGFIAAPAVAVLHVPHETAQVVVGINWISGGLACVVLDVLKRR
jgi:hypothetical protein